MTEHNNYAVDFFAACKQIKQVCPGCKISGGVSNIAFSFRGNEPVRRCASWTCVFGTLACMLLFRLGLGECSACAMARPWTTHPVLLHLHRGHVQRSQMPALQRLLCKLDFANVQC